MGRTKGSKNKSKQATDTKIVPLVVQEKKPRASKTDGFTHGLCGKIWPTDLPACPHCYPK